MSDESEAGDGKPFLSKPLVWIIYGPFTALLLLWLAIEMAGAENVRGDVRTMGGEDFSAFLAKVPGCFVAVGSRNESRGLTWDHHHPRFDVDEQSLAIGAELLLRTTKRFLGA